MIRLVDPDEEGPMGKEKKPEKRPEKHPKLERDTDGNIPGILTMGDMIDDQDRRKDRKK